MRITCVDVWNWNKTSQLSAYRSINRKINKWKILAILGENFLSEKCSYCYCVIPSRFSVAPRLWVTRNGTERHWELTYEIEMAILGFWASVFSYEGQDDLTGQRIAHKPGTWRASLPCVFGSAASTRQSARIAIRIQASDICTAFHLKQRRIPH